MVVSQGRQRWLGRTEDRGEGNEAERDETALLHSDPRRYGMHRHARHAYSGEEADALGERDLAAGDADDDDEWNGEDVLEESDAKIGLLDSVVEETFVDPKSDVSEAIRGEPRNARERGGLVARGVEDTRTCDDTNTTGPCLSLMALAKVLTVAELSRRQPRIGPTRRQPR